MGTFCTAGQAKDDDIIRHIRCVCRINKATDIHLESAIFISFPRQKWLRECASILPLYAHCLSRCISDDYQRKTLPFFLNNISQLALVMETAFVS